MRVIKTNDLLQIGNRFPLFFLDNYAAYELKRGWEVVLATDDNNAVIAFKTRSSKFIKQGQYLYPPMKDGERLSPPLEAEFMKELHGFCRRSGICDFITPPLHFSLFQILPPHSFYTEMGIITMNLNRSNDDLFATFSSSCRNKIRKAIAGGVHVKFDNSLFHRFYEVYKEVHARQNIYYDSKDDLENLITCMGPENCRIVCAAIGEQIYSAALILLSGNEAYYYQSGTAENNPNPGINNLLQFEIMKQLRSEGVTRYCMGGYRPGDIKGTKYEGIQNFKLSFGADIEKGYHFYSQVTWKYTVYKSLLRWYLRFRGVEQNYSGMNYKYN